MAAPPRREEFQLPRASRADRRPAKKGLDTTEYVVDLELKLAVPFICAVMG